MPKAKNMFDYSTPAGSGNKNLYFERKSLKKEVASHQAGHSYENTLAKHNAY